ncbi:MAG: pitrilysin family protein, partial [Planctomycetota bacterium]
PGRDPSGAPEATDESNDMEATEPESTPPSDNETTTAEVQFPADYSTAAPVPADIIAANFDTGVVFDVDGTQVILIRDTRQPLVGMTLIMPGYGSDAVPADKVGLASLAADLLTRGSAGRSAAEQNELLDAAGISLSASDGGDHTRVTGSFPKGSMADAVMFANELLTQPNLDEREFANLRARAAAGLQQSLSDPSGVASRELDTLLFGDTPAGRNPDPRIVASLTLEDAVEHVKRAYGREGQTLILAGDLDEAEATEFASKLLDGVKLSSSKTIDPIAYELSAYRPQILLVDNPGGGQSAVRLGNRAFKIDSDEKYAASVATQVLAGGIESRLNQAMRAEKGLTYGAGGRFNPGRHVGEFFVGFATRPETTGEAITTAFGVLTRMASESVSEEELVDAQRRVAGSLVLSQQTVGQLANLRGNILLNGYPLSYFNDYGQKIAGVDVQDVQNVIASYATPDLLSIVVVAPADAVKTQLDQIGDVTVVPMPLARQPEAMTP